MQIQQVIEKLQDQIDRNSGELALSEIKLAQTNSEISRGEIPEEAPSRIQARIEYQKGLSRGLSHARDLLRGE